MFIGVVLEHCFSSIISIVDNSRSNLTR